MPFVFNDNVPITSTELSNWYWGVADATTDVVPPLTPIAVANIQLAINAITDQIEKFIGYPIKSASYTEIWDGAGSDELVPQVMPITAVTSIKISASGDFASSVGIPSQNIGFDKWSIKLRWQQFPRGRSIIEVVYVAGYTTVPSDMKAAMFMQFQYMYKKIGKGDSMTGLKSISKGIGGGSESFTKDDGLGSKASGGLLSEVSAMLADYQRLEAPSSVMFSRTS